MNSTPRDKDNRRVLAGSFRYVLTDSVIILFFLSVIMFYYARLYTETRQGIIKDGQVSATETAHRIDKYLAIGTETMRSICYTLDNMIRDDRSQAEIEDFLVSQSSLIENLNPEITNGVYGYIRGEYLDGSGWIPDADYVPTERPWYVSAHADFGDVAVVEPYLDMQTNTVLISLSKTLCDSQSVVAMDYPITYVQSVVESIYKKDPSQTEIILDGYYQVIAHSDPREVGKAYAQETGTFGSAVVRAIQESGSAHSSLSFGSNSYIVYAESVENDWLCVSVVDATTAFLKLRDMLILTIFISILVILILSLIMIRSNRKSQQTLELQENLSEVEKVAFQDSLTGVRTKAAFDQFCEETDGRIACGMRELAVVMMDVNDLKFVNDSFGHDKGDIYLRGSCRIACNVYSHSPIFRIGGDEFVAILQNADYENRVSLISLLRESFEESHARTDVDPWERYSLVAGMADCSASDTSISQILKRADEAMYQEKQAFKAANGSHRD